MAKRGRRMARAGRRWPGPDRPVARTGRPVARTGRLPWPGLLARAPGVPGRRRRLPRPARLPLGYGMSAIFPLVWPRMMARCAAAAPASGNVCVTNTRSLPSWVSWARGSRAA